MSAVSSLSATLCLTTSAFLAGTAAAQPASTPSLTVTPASPINISGAQGGPFSPSSFQYRLIASTATIRFTVTPPFWITADPRVGTVGTDGVIVTLLVNPRALKLTPRAYQAPVTFTNLTNGQGSITRTAILTVQASPTRSGILAQGFWNDSGVWQDTAH